ncbi:YcaO-like family protein [Shinella sp. CPCC 101442]|uniref:YcaO-like family protein n=1 Tax=Shinella sp. CPCC 101442 TaxID=2932265 RepID=UPI0021522E4F|nr:YcaO-like family protein [Shinella sp. CPCC 101442]MCR6502210.1 YcaO-like family protein [Shinella sp. CPCC 101442]
MADTWTSEATTGHSVTTYSDRICGPDETWSRIEALLPRFGVTRLSRLTGLDRLGIPVWNAVSPNARSIVINQGKGITDIDAKVSAAMEALERAIAGDPFVPARKTSRRAFAEAGEACLPLDIFIAAGQPFIDEDEELHWLAGRDVVTGEHLWLPREAICLDRTNPAPRFWQSSDGLASGNSEVEAILHGLLERIERDADRLWRLLPRVRRLACAVDPADIDDPVVTDLAGRFRDAGLDLKLFDITSDLAIPTYAAVLGNEGLAEKQQPLFHDATIGYGTHPVGSRAVIRALTEVAQSRLTYISGARDDLFAESFTRPLAPETLALFGATPGLARTYPSPEGDAAALLAHCLEKLAVSGIKPVIAVPLHDASLPVSVVKVVVPALENPEGARRHTVGTRALSSMLFGAP